MHCCDSPLPGRSHVPSGSGTSTYFPTRLRIPLARPRSTQGTDTRDGDARRGRYADASYAMKERERERDVRDKWQEKGMAGGQSVAELVSEPSRLGGGGGGDNGSGGDAYHTIPYHTNGALQDAHSCERNKNRAAGTWAKTERKRKYARALCLQSGVLCLQGRWSARGILLPAFR